MIIALVVVVVIVSYALNALADSIDHMKGAQDLFELWHVLKSTSYALPYGTLLLLSKAHWGWWVGIAPVLWIVWECTYYWGRYVELWRLDNEWRLKWLGRLFGIKL